MFDKMVILLHAEQVDDDGETYCLSTSTEADIDAKATAGTVAKRQGRHSRGAGPGVHRIEVLQKFAVELDTSVVRATGMRQRQRAILFCPTCTKLYRRQGDLRYRGHAHLAGAVAVDRSCVCACSHGSWRKITKGTAASFLLIGSLIADSALKLKVEEDHSLAEYAAFITESTVSRAAKVGEIEELEGTRAVVSASSSATETAQGISSLHQSCDWLLQNCDLWKSAPFW